jgi:hypothetical protein
MIALRIFGVSSARVADDGNVMFGLSESRRS